jgi:Flp pilus assembly protein TadB
MGGLLHVPGLAVGGLLAGFAAARWRAGERRRRTQDEEESRAELGLQTLLRLVRSGQAFMPALDVVISPTAAASPAPHAAVRRLGDMWPVPAVARAVPALEAALRYGGAVEPVLRDTLEQLRLDRQARWDWEAATASARTSLMLVGLGPWGVLLVFRLLLPGFFTALTGGLVQWVWVWCGFSLLAVTVVADGRWQDRA